MTYTHATLHRASALLLVLFAVCMVNCGPGVASSSSNNPGESSPAFDLMEEEDAYDMGQWDHGVLDIEEDMLPGEEDMGASDVVWDMSGGQEDFGWVEEDMGQIEEDLGQVEEDMPAPVDMSMDEETAPPEPVEEPDPREPNNQVVKTTRFGGLHWNIAGGKENNCKTAGITRAVMRYIKSAGHTVDFISLNEICRAQYDSIQRELRRYWKKGGGAKFSAFQSNGRNSVGNAIFSRRTLTTITRLKVGEDRWGNRYLLCGKQKGRRVRVCTTHLTPADSTARVQLVRVLNKIESFWSAKKETVIIGGDFNIHSNDQGFNKMYSSKVNTPNNRNNHGRYREWDDNDPNHCKGYGQRSLPGTAGGPCRQGGKIDFIFTRENRIVNDTYDAKSLNIPNDCTGVCSDHRAIRGFAKIRYRID